MNQLDTFQIQRRPAASCIALSMHLLHCVEVFNMKNTLDDDTNVDTLDDADMEVGPLPAETSTP